MDAVEVNPFDKLTDKHKKFVIEYLDCLNASEAYRRAGYSAKAANVAGPRLLADVRIRAAVSHLGEQIGMSAGEAFKHFTDIARSRINDYLLIKKVLRTPTVRKPLQTIIDELDAEILFEDDFAKLAAFNKKEKAFHEAGQKERRRNALRYALELERNPSAYRDVNGEAEWVEEIRVDLVALAKAKAEGRIKSLSFTEFGPKVELESVSNALDKVMQLHGRYKQLPGDANQPKVLQSYTLPDGTTITF